MLAEAGGRRGVGRHRPASSLCAGSPERDRGRGRRRLQAGLPEAELQTDPQAPQAAPGTPGGGGGAGGAWGKAGPLASTPSRRGRSKPGHPAEGL